MAFLFLRANISVVHQIWYGKKTNYHSQYFLKSQNKVTRYGNCECY